MIDDVADEVEFPEARPLAIANLTPHPRNYRRHPEDQIAHIMQSLREHGFYRNVVVARDMTMLAGHGVLIAATRLGLATVPGVELDLDPMEPRALKILAGDNELARFADDDDRMLTDLLREIKDNNVAGLLGTGYDEQMLASLVFVTRPESEIANMDAAAQWVGLPGFESPQGKELLLVVHFDDEAGRDELVEKLGMVITRKERLTWSGWYPPREKRDMTSVEFDG